MNILAHDLEYFNQMALLNGLTGSAGVRPVFKPGMLFDSEEKWWDSPGRRPSPHEGLDICLYQQNKNPIETVGSGLKVPPVRPGKVVKICDDFLGQTVILSHEWRKAGTKELLSLYAHLVPAQGIRPGKYMDKNALVGTIAEIDPQKTSIPSHLHLSIFWNETPFVYDHLEWDRLSRRQGVSFVDPLAWLGASKEV